MITIDARKDRVSFRHSDTPRLLDMAGRITAQSAVEYLLGYHQPNYQVPAIRQCYCGYTLQQHRDEMPCDNLGLLNY